MKSLMFIFGLLMALSLISASNYQITYTQIGDKIFIKEMIDEKQISNLSSNELLEKSSEGYYFVKKLTFNQSYSEAEVILNLDIGFILEEGGVFPSDYEIKSDGQVISIIWKFSNVKPNDASAIFVKIRDTTKSYSSIWVGIIILLILIGAFLLYKKFLTLKMRNKASGKKRIRKRAITKEAEYSHLLDTEKKVIDELKKADRNEMWQKQIQEPTGFSKAKVSRLVRNLEARGLIVKIPFGNTNKIRLK